MTADPVPDEAGDPVASAERALGLAGDAFAAFDVEAAVAHLSTAVRGFTDAGLPCRAAMACVHLGDALANGMGNLTAGRAWFARATRLVADQPDCLEQGWVAVAPMGCDVDDPDDLLQRADLALDRARRFGDLNLETKALADGGLALVQAGQIAEGMARLDEAMALACGPADDGDTAAKSVCSFFTACYHAVDVERAGTWADLLRRRGVLGPVPGPALFLSSHCDSVQATLLMELGRWGEAEAVLVRAKHDLESSMGIPAWHPDIALADLRIRQGRLSEAEALLLGKDQSIHALVPAARLHLERGEADLAVAACRRGLRAIGSDRLRAVDLLEIELAAHLARGDLAATTTACDALTDRAGDLAVPALRSRVAAAQGRVQAERGDHTGAAELLESAVDGLDPGRLPWSRARLLVELARVHEGSGDEGAATRAAAAGAAALGALDVVPSPADAALLARLGAGAGAGGRVDRAGTTRAPVAEQPPGRDVVELRIEGRFVAASKGGASTRLPATKGLRYLLELVATPGVERHALDLVDRIEGTTPGGPDRRALGDAGSTLDARARAAYRRRIEELRGEADDALAEGRLDAAEAIQAELDQLVGQLAAAFGLGGRSRVAASAAERARLNVTRALRAATSRLDEALPGTGAALDRRIRTGTYCAYEPHEGDPDCVVLPPA